MKIAHLALWTNDIEAMKRFYCHYFEGEAGVPYRNEKKDFNSYFIHFESGATLELMSTAGLVDSEVANMSSRVGLAHFAFSIGSKAAVKTLTETFRKDGFTIVSEVRVTGDGYYESVILDPDGNVVELTI